MAELKQEIRQLRAEVKELKREVRELKTLILDITKVEVWTDISVAPEYDISSFGRVRRKKPRMDGSDFFPKPWRNSMGYIRVRLNNKNYLLHRLLAQAFIPNPEGKPCVDHRDGNPQNNSLENLRWCTHAENNRNSKKRKDNTSDHKGVSFHKAKGKWRAYIYVNGKQKSLGYFHTKEEAAAAYEKAARELHGEFFCNRR